MNTIKVYKFVNSRYGLWDLCERKIKISRLDDLNDPFELRAVRTSRPEFNQILENARTKFSKNTGLLCFCEDWFNPVLWAHYAEGHQGLCLGFEILKDNVTKVKYVEKPIIADSYFKKLIAESVELITKKSNYLSNYNSSKDFELIRREADAKIRAEIRKAAESDEEGIRLMEENLLTKYSYWSYEKEHRFITKLNQGFYDFTSYTDNATNNIKLTEVIVGLKSNLSVKAVQNALGDSFEYVKIFKAEMHDEKFEMKRTQEN